jgi:hypothetical protein
MFYNTKWNKKNGTETFRASVGGLYRGAQRIQLRQLDLGLFAQRLKKVISSKDQNPYQNKVEIAGNMIVLIEETAGKQQQYVWLDE